MISFVNRFRYINSNFTKYRCSISMDMYRSTDQVPTSIPCQCVFKPPYTPVTPPNRHETDLKPTKIIEFGGDRFAVGLESVLSVWDWYVFGQSNLLGRDLSNIFESSLPDKLSVACQLCVGVESVLSGSVQGHVGESSVTDGTWFVGLKSVMYWALVGRPDTDARPNQVQHYAALCRAGQHVPESRPTRARHTPNPNRMQNRQLFVTSYLHIKGRQ